MLKPNHQVCSDYAGFSQTAWEGETTKNNAVKVTGVALPLCLEFSSASSGKLESNVPKQQIYFSTSPSLFKMLDCM